MVTKTIDSHLLGAVIRSGPGFGDNVLGYLMQGDAVKIVGQPATGRWLPCDVKLESKIRRGYVSKNVVRDRLSEPKEALIQSAVRHYFDFDKGKGKEHVSPYFKKVGKFWQAIGHNLDGRDTDTPWSAAFISACIKEAGGYSGFKYSAAHSRYVHQSIRRKIENKSGPFWGEKISAVKPQIGDLVCRSRTSRRITYDYASKNEYYKSHCDIVIRVMTDHVSAIGGNLSNSVSRVTYPLDSRGFLKSEGGVYALMSNRR